VLEGNEAFIATRDYGKIKLTYGFGGVSFWLRPSQRKQLEKLLVHQGVKRAGDRVN
jgi:hypothetical protein